MDCQKPGYLKLPRRENNTCFGCSPKNPSGLHMEFWSNGQTVLSCLTVPERFTGWKQVVHGGIVSTILDEVMSWSAIYLLERFVMTKSMTVDFLKPVYADTRIEVEGRVAELLSDREALMEAAIVNEKGVVRARARGTFALFTPNSAKRLGVLDDDLFKDFKRLTQHRP